MDIKGAVFDLDGTLVDSGRIADILWEELGKKYLNDENFKPNEEEDKAFRTMALKDTTQYLHDVYGMGESGAQLLKDTDYLMGKFYSEEVKPKKGVVQFLEYLKKNNVGMCVSSATGKKLITIALEHVGISEYFSEIFSCADIGKGKDEPDIFLETMKHLNLKPEEICVFEDSLIAIRTAKALGMQTVGIYDENNFSHEEIEKTADVYIARGESFEKIIDTP